MVQSTFLYALVAFTGLMEATPIRRATPAYGKRGLAFPKQYKRPGAVVSEPGSGFTHAFDGQTSLNWMYDWEAVIDGPPVSGLEYVPLLHSNEAWCTEGWTQNVAAAQKKYNVKYVLSFNEPDQTGGGGTSMKVDDAVKAHRKYMQPLANSGLKIGSPAVTNGPELNKGMDYLNQFMAGCSDCQIDFVVTHYYASDDVNAFVEYLTKFHDTYKKDVWLTEFGVNPGQGDANAFLKNVLPWLDGTSWIKRYAYHMVAPDVEGKNYLVQPDGKTLTDTGYTYATTSGTKTTI